MSLSGIELGTGILVGAPKALDTKYGPFTGVDIAAAKTAALTAVTAGFRFEGLTCGLIVTGQDIVEYQFKGGIADVNFVEKTIGNSATLGINMNFNVCQPISTSTNWPDNNPGINWYFQAGGPVAQKWTPTANNPRVKRKHFLGTESSVDIITTVTAMSDNFNNIQWVLKMVDPANPLTFTDLAGSLLPVGPASPVITIGGSYGTFGPGWTENTVFGFDLATDYFDLHNVTEGQLELHIYNNGSNGSIITGCTTQFATT